MTLYEQEKKNEIVQSGFTLTVGDEKGGKNSFNLKSRAGKLPARMPLGGNDTALTLNEILEHASETRYLIESDKEEPNAAVHLNLSSSLMSFNEKFTLIAKDPDNPDSSVKDVGPAHFILKKNSVPSVKLVIQRPGSRPFSVNLDTPLKKNIPLGNSDLEIVALSYFPHAKVSEDKLVNSPDDTPFNPAVELEIHDGAGQKEFHTKFLLFPDFASIRGGKKADRFGLDVHLEARTEETLAGVPTMIIHPSTQSSWQYEIHSSKGLLKQGELKLHDKIETGWRDITIEVLQMFNRAQVLRKIKPADSNASGVFALRVSHQDEGLSRSAWVTENSSSAVETKKGILNLALEPVKAPLPFELTLKDFRKTDYPGTTSPASFESDVTLFDPAKKITFDKTIRMNEPLDYAGWRVFQSSYIQDPEHGEASVFTIAKNPGIKFIYSGGMIILTGVILLFYFHPFFNPNVRSKSVQ